MPVNFVRSISEKSNIYASAATVSSSGFDTSLHAPFSLITMTRVFRLVSARGTCAGMGGGWWVCRSGGWLFFFSRDENVRRGNIVIGRRAF